MIKCHLSKLMGERKLKVTDVARDTGINRGTITRLYHETATRIELDVIEELCRYLDCKVGDLLEIQLENGGGRTPLESAKKNGAIRSLVDTDRRQQTSETFPD